MKREEKTINISCTIDSPVYLRVKCASAIFEQYGDFLRAITYLHIKNKSLVDDIMQSFFLSIVEHPIREDIEDIKGYLYRAIINDVIDSTRRIKDYETKVKRYNKIVHNYSIKKQSPHEKTLLERDEITQLFKVIKKNLPQQEAEAILYFYSLRKNFSAAAKKMNVDIKTFKRYVYVGLNKFRQLLQLSDSENI